MKTATEIMWEQELSHDDRPSESNYGVIMAGLCHLERYGFKEHERVKITVRIEAVAQRDTGEPL